MLHRIAEGVWAAESELRLPAGVRMPIRMTVLDVGGGELLLHSPIAIDDDLRNEIAELGRVRHVLAPNLLHHLHAAPALARFPGSRLYAPPGLAEKCPGLEVHRTLDGPVPPELDAELELELVRGVPKLNEVVVLHRRSGTLVVADLVFNVVAPRGLGAHLLFLSVGCHGRLAQSRAFRFMTRDRAAAGESARRILNWRFERLIPAHGEVLAQDAPARLAAALERMADPLGAVA
jgi:hypothetical protein